MHIKTWLNHKHYLGTEFVLFCFFSFIYYVISTYPMAFIFMTSDSLFFKGHSKIQFSVNSLEARTLFEGFNVRFI